MILNRLAAGGTELENGVAKLSESTPKLVDGADKINTGLKCIKILTYLVTAT